MTDSRLNKQLWTDINKLRLLRKADSNVRFLLDKSPFDEFDEEEETGASASPKHIVIIGRILPESEIYREGAYQIEMKLLPTYPFDPPDVRFLTPIYHPNVGKDGRLSDELLKKATKWTHRTLLVEAVRGLKTLIDRPDIDYSISLDLARQYMENKSEFDRKAMEYVKKYALPRF